MNRDQFRSTEQLCKRLNDLLEDPTMKLAIEIVNEEMVPSPPVSGRGDLIQQAAVEGMQCSGAARFVRLLRHLTIPDMKTQPEKTTLQDEAAIEQMIAKGYSREEAIAGMKDFYKNQTT